MKTLILLLVMINLGHIEDNNEKEISLNSTYQAGIKLEIEGVVVCNESGDKVHSSELKNQIKKKPSVQEVINVLGPGYLNSNSGTGGISWYFSDESEFVTGLWPQSLNVAVKLIMPEWQRVNSHHFFLALIVYTIGTWCPLCSR